MAPRAACPPDPDLGTVIEVCMKPESPVDVLVGVLVGVLVNNVKPTAGGCFY